MQVIKKSEQETKQKKIELTRDSNTDGNVGF